MKREELQILQGLSLELKIAKSKLRIEEWVRYWGANNCYVSFSGGKDSTVLLHLVRSLYPNIEAVFVDTGLEYKELKDHVKKQDNVTILRPKKSFKQVIEEHGYPVISKEQARYIRDVQVGTAEAREKRLNFDGGSHFVISKKWRFMVDAPFKVSNYCCDIMKKNPVKCYENKEGKVAFIGTLAVESKLRTTTYLNTGCNAFDKKRPTSTPLGFWTEQDVLAYIKMFNLEVPSVYGDIVTQEDGTLRFTGVQRTGCLFCGFGVHLEKEPNRFQLLKQSHPQIHEYCMNKLGLKEVLDYMKVPTE